MSIKNDLTRRKVFDDLFKVSDHYMSGIITQGMRALLFIDAIRYIARVDSKNEVIHGVSVRVLF